VAALVAVAAVAWALAASCRTVPQPRPGDPGRAPAAAPQGAGADALSVESLVAAPVVRVGILVDVPRTAVTAEGGVIVRGRGLSGEEKEARLGRATFNAVAPTGAGVRYRVQVGSLADQDAAEEFAAQVKDRARLDPIVRRSDETRTYQVRVGDFPDREQAVTFANQLQAGGLSGGWVAEEPRAAESGRIRLVETNEELTFATVFPQGAPDGLVADGLAFRGLLEVRPAETGLTVVNALNIEDYLKGVVPNELSPDAFPELEALKAQAVAARTYVLRNRGGYASRGYDICATPACQVYRGKSTEKELATQAVEQTRGMAATYRGVLINALYTSTCGGHTETGTNIFAGEQTTPYLVGVSCAPEREAWATVHTTAAPRALGDLPELNRHAALLVSLDVLPAKAYAAGALTHATTDEELRDWSGRLARALQRQPCAVAGEGALTRRGTFFQHLVGTLCWEERAKRLLTPQDSDYLLAVEDRADLGGPKETLAAALLVQEGVVRLFPDNTLRPNATLTRAQAIEIFGRAALKAGPSTFVTGIFKGISGGGLLVRQDDGRETNHLIDPGARLFRSLDGSRLGTSELDLAAGDTVSFVEQSGRITFLEAVQSLLGAAADRSSRYYRWEVRLTPEQVAQAIARYGTVGRVKDVVPRRYGVSGRVIEAKVVGTEGELPLEGLRVRWGLGLRENLFVVDRERDAAGNVTKFIFTGKGWGHGVGLCQVGSFGMAHTGSTFDSILRHYYTGINLARQY
jgi:stage II sporulation protein D